MDKVKRRVAAASRHKYVRFGLVGVVNTAVDFGLFNTLILVIGLPVIVANVIATTTAMFVSFLLNRNSVFRSKGNSRIEIVLFFATTLTGLWIIQNGAILLLYPLFGTLPVALKLNLIKAIAIIIGLVWNYLWYSRVVFNERRKEIPGKILRHLDSHWSKVVIFVIAISAIVALALGLGRSVWFDEGYSIMVAQRPVSELVALTKVDAHPPLYYLYLKSWGGLFGWSELSLRLSSIIPGALSLGIMAAIIRRLFDSKVALATIPFLVIAPFLARYDYEIRMYSLVMFIGVLGTYVFLRAVETHAKKWWLAYAVIVALGMYTLYMSVVIWLGHVIWLAYQDVKKKRNFFKRKELLYYGLSLLLFIPWIPVVIGQLNNSALPPYLTQLDPTAFVTMFLLVLAYAPIWDGNAIVIAGAVVFVALFGWLLIKIRRLAKPKTWLHIMLFVIMVLSALVFYWVMSIPPNPPRFAERYMIHVSVYFYALVGILVAVGYQLRIRRLAIAVGVLAMGLFIYGLVSLSILGNYNFQRLQPTYSKTVRADVGCSKDTTIVTSGAYGYVDMWYAFQGCDFRYYQPVELTYTGGYAPLNELNTTKRVKQISDVTAKEIAFIYYDDSTEFPNAYPGYTYNKTLKYNGLRVGIYYRD